MGQLQDRRDVVSDDGTDERRLAFLREKYASERAKRLHPSQSEHNVDAAIDSADFAEDPYITSRLERAPVVETTEVVIVGGGFGGLVCAAKLRNAGIEDFRIIESGGDFGGTWYWNRYPGVQCDIESYIYLPLLEETGYIPSEKYAHGPEIFEHARRVGNHFDLYPHALFQTRVLDMRWAEGDRRWTVLTDRQDEIRARYVISATGSLSKVRLPGIPGLSDFKGRAFHTSRWDYDYTGGSPEGGLVKLHDKRVAVIGTGATAIQCVSYVAESAKHLYVFQRTPSTVGFRGNKPTEADWASTLASGWQKQRADNFEFILQGGNPERDLVEDGWTSLNRSVRLDVPAESLSDEERVRRLEQIDFMKGEEIRSRIGEVVSKPEVAEALKPWYRIYCKRPTFNDDYYPSFNRSNVTLVDTQGKGVEKITEHEVVSNGESYPVDCIIFATGFDVGSELSSRSGFEVYGRDGRTLTEHHHDGPRTFHGFYSHGFPNFFILGVSQNGLSANFTRMLTEQSEHITNLIADLKRRGVTRVEATAEAEADWQEVIRKKAEARRAFLSSCTPGYYNGEGELERGLLVNVYAGGPFEFSALLDDWRSRGEMFGLAID
jgi:cyclohexanone monooxygenase